MIKNQIPERGHTTPADRENHGGSGLGASSCSHWSETEKCGNCNVVGVTHDVSVPGEGDHNVCTECADLAIKLGGKSRLIRNENSNIKED